MHQIQNFLALRPRPPGKAHSATRTHACSDAGIQHLWRQSVLGLVREPVAIKGVPWDFSAEIVVLI